MEKEENGDREKMGGTQWWKRVPMKECRVNEGKDQNGNMSQYYTIQNNYIKYTVCYISYG